MLNKSKKKFKERIFHFFQSFHISFFHCIKQLDKLYLYCMYRGTITVRLIITWVKITGMWLLSHTEQPYLLSVIQIPWRNTDQSLMVTSIITVETRTDPTITVIDRVKSISFKNILLADKIFFNQLVSMIL